MTVAILVIMVVVDLCCRQVGIDVVVVMVVVAIAIVENIATMVTVIVVTVGRSCRCRDHRLVVIVALVVNVNGV